MKPCEDEISNILMSSKWDNVCNRAQVAAIGHTGDYSRSLFRDPRPVPQSNLQRQLEQLLYREQ